MKKLIYVICLVSASHAVAIEFLGTSLFNNDTVSVTTPVASKVVDVYGYTAIDWKGQGAAVKGTFTAQVSNDSSRWYDLSKDFAGANVSMAITSTGTTTSGVVNFGYVPYRFMRLIYTPDPAVATGAVINSAYMSRQ